MFTPSPPPYTTITRIVDTVIPLTKEDQHCGFRKAKKLRARSELIDLINQYKQGKPVILPEQVLKMLQ